MDCQKCNFWTTFTLFRIALVLNCFAILEFHNYCFTFFAAVLLLVLVKKMC